MLIDAELRERPEDPLAERSGVDVRPLSQYWTLGLRDGLWTLLRIEERAQGKHHLAEPIGAAPLGHDVDETGASSMRRALGAQPS